MALYARLADTPGTRPEPVDPLFRAMAEHNLAITLREMGRINEARRERRPIYLVSASNRRLVEAVADHVGLFTGWFASDERNNIAGEAKAQLRRIKENVDAIISGAGEKGREAREAVLDVTENFTDALEDSLQARPLTTLALAIGVGFVFGATWRR